MAQAQIKSDGRTPRWVKIFAVITIILILLFVILTLIGGGGGHGPGRHTSPGDTGGDTSPANVTEDEISPAGDHTPPVEHGGQQP